MHNFVKYGLTFISGAVVGAIAAKFYVINQLKKDFEFIEADDVEDGTSEENDVQEESRDNVIVIEASTRESRAEYAKIKSVNDAEYNRLLDELRYNSQSEVIESLCDDAEVVDLQFENNTNQPYFIREDQFDELDDFESDEYTFYADGYLTDSAGFPVDNDTIQNSIGINFEDRFKETGEDQIYIRNERLGMDFSIVRDLDNFLDVAPPRIKKLMGL